MLHQIQIHTITIVKTFSVPISFSPSKNPKILRIDEEKHAKL